MDKFLVKLPPKKQNPIIETKPNELEKKIINPPKKQLYTYKKRNIEDEAHTDVKIASGSDETIWDPTNELYKKRKLSKSPITLVSTHCYINSQFENILKTINKFLNINYSNCYTFTNINYKINWVVTKYDKKNVNETYEHYLLCLYEKVDYENIESINYFEKYNGGELNSDIPFDTEYVMEVIKLSDHHNMFSLFYTEIQQYFQANGLSNCLLDKELKLNPNPNPNPNPPQNNNDNITELLNTLNTMTINSNEELPPAKRKYTRRIIKKLE